MSRVHVVVPADIDDPHRPSGGNVYDRRVIDGLPAVGRPVTELAVDGTWPQPDDHARAALDRVLSAVPDGGEVLLDGLVACGVPEVLVPHTGRLRLVVLVHLPLGDERGLAPDVAAALTARERAVLHACSAVVATSRWTARRLTEVHGLTPHRVHVAPPGVDPAPLTEAGEAGARLLCVGSITPTKGQDVLVDALAWVADLGWTCRLVGPVTRDAAHVTAVGERIERHGLRQRVQLTGPRAGPDLDATWADTDVLIVPSRAEAYGMVVTEALARGIPVLASAVDGVPDALGRAPGGQVPGVLVAPGIEPLARALRAWLTDPGLRATLRRSAHARRPELDGWEVTSRCLAHALTPAGTRA